MATFKLILAVAYISVAVYAVIQEKRRKVKNK